MYFSAVFNKPAMRKSFSAAMMMINLAVCIAQIPTRKEIAAKRTSLPIKIDGELNEEAWKGAPAVNNFVEQRPSFGNAEKEKSKTEMFILYDDNAIYISGICRRTTWDILPITITTTMVFGWVINGLSQKAFTIIYFLMPMAIIHTGLNHVHFNMFL